jgi:hypothetical protein
MFHHYSLAFCRADIAPASAGIAVAKSIKSQGRLRKAKYCEASGFRAGFVLSFVVNGGSSGDLLILFELSFETIACAFLDSELDCCASDEPVLNRGEASGRVVAIDGDSRSVAKIYHDPANAAAARDRLAATLARRANLKPPRLNGVEYVQSRGPMP